MQGRHGLEGIELEDVYTLHHLDEPDSVVTPSFAADLRNGDGSPRAGGAHTTCLALLSNSSEAEEEEDLDADADDDDADGAGLSTSEEALDAEIMAKRLSQRWELEELDRAVTHALALPTDSEGPLHGAGGDQKEDGREQTPAAGDFDEPEEALLMV